jgi:hypothetical protein
MIHKGSCHCGRIAFEVEGDVSQVMECKLLPLQQEGLLTLVCVKAAVETRCIRNHPQYLHVQQARH